MYAITITTTHQRPRNVTSTYQTRHDHRAPSGQVLHVVLDDHLSLGDPRCLVDRQIPEIQDALHKHTRCWKTIRHNIRTTYKDFTVSGINVALVYNTMQACLRH